MPLYEVCTPLLLLQLATNNADWRTSCGGVEARKIDTQPVVLAHEHMYTSSIFRVFSTVELKVFWAHAIVQWRGNCAEVMELMADKTHDLSTTSQMIEISNLWYMATNKHASLQCSPTSVGLTQAHPNHYEFMRRGGQKTRSMDKLCVLLSPQPTVTKERVLLYCTCTLCSLKEIHSFLMISIL